jgi:hypothetical protein
VAVNVEELVLPVRTVVVNEAFVMSFSFHTKPDKASPSASVAAALRPNGVPEEKGAGSEDGVRLAQLGGVFFVIFQVRLSDPPAFETVTVRTLAAPEAICDEVRTWLKSVFGTVIPFSCHTALQVELVTPTLKVVVPPIAAIFTAARVGEAEEIAQVAVGESPAALSSRKLENVEFSQALKVRRVKIRSKEWIFEIILKFHHQSAHERGFFGARALTCRKHAIAS